MIVEDVVAAMVVAERAVAIVQISVKIGVKDALVVLVLANVAVAADVKAVGVRLECVAVAVEEIHVMRIVAIVVVVAANAIRHVVELVLEAHVLEEHAVAVAVELVEIVREHVLAVVLVPPMQDYK